MTNTTVVVPIYGDLDTWRKLAQRAKASVLGANCFISVGDDIASARNKYIPYVDTEYTMFLDADDELHYGFFDKSHEWTGDIIKPSVEINSVRVPFDERDIRKANYLIAGCPVRTELLQKWGGFKNLPCFEDWELWARLIRRGGAEVEERPESRYYYNKSSQGRDANYDAAEALQVVKQIMRY